MRLISLLPRRFGRLLRDRNSRSFSLHVTRLRSSVVRFVEPVGATEVVVSFEGADPTIPRKDHNRPGFGEKFLLGKGYAVVSILTHSAHWYRSEDIQTFLAASELQEFLSKFQRVHTYGSSMGGFAAIVFAPILKAYNVIALQPVSTLRPDLVPWENRFVHGTKLNWHGGFNDAAAEVAQCKSVWALFDPEDMDARHVKRLAEKAPDTLYEIHVKGAAHAVPRKLLALGILSEVVCACLEGKSKDSVQKIVSSARGLTDAS